MKKNLIFQQKFKFMNLKADVPFHILVNPNKNSILAYFMHKCSH